MTPVSQSAMSQSAMSQRARSATGHAAGHATVADHDPEETRETTDGTGGTTGGIAVDLDHDLATGVTAGVIVAATAGATVGVEAVGIGIGGGRALHQSRKRWHTLLIVGCSQSHNLDHSTGVSLKAQLRGWAEGKYVADTRNLCARFSACSVLDRGAENQARAQGDGSQPNPRAGKKLNRSTWVQQWCLAAMPTVLLAKQIQHSLICCGCT